MTNNSLIAVVTGASRGIGRATALLLAKHGYQICVNYNKNQAAAIEVVNLIKRAGGQAIAIQTDTSDETQVVQMFEQVDNQLGQITALVNNAGILFTQSSIEDLNAERINTILKTNVTGTILCCREVVKRMSYHHGGNGGSIVNLSSHAAVLGSAHEYIDYAASKGAIDSFTIGLAQEVAKQGIRVNAVRPGVIDTEMHADGGEANRVHRLKTLIPLQRYGTAEDVAAAIYWLISEQSAYSTGAYSTGTFIDVSGGR